MKRLVLTAGLSMALSLVCTAQVRKDVLLREGWQFSLGDSTSWKSVTVHHDWAITGPFDINNDLQKVAVVQNGETVASLKTVRTAGRPYALRLTPASSNVASGGIMERDGDQIAYLTVSVVDRDGVEVPDASHLVEVSVSGPGRFRAMANGDPTCLELFHLPHMHLFAGKLSVLVQAGTGPKEDAIEVTVKAKGLKPATIRF